MTSPQYSLPCNQPCSSSEDKEYVRNADDPIRCGLTVYQRGYVGMFQQLRCELIKSHHYSERFECILDADEAVTIKISVGSDS